MTTQLVDTGLQQYIVQSIGTPTSFWGAWFTCTAGDAANIGATRRAQSYAVSSSIVSFWPGGGAWPTPPSTNGTYEVHPRWRRDRKLAALNDASMQLGLRWYREFVDTSITTAAQTWQYTLPSSQNIAGVSSVEIQIDTNAADVGFPYQDAMMYDWKFWQTTDATGAMTSIIQFGALPPYPRTLRVRGWSYVPELVNDSDVLPTSGKWEGAALGWIYRWANFVLNEWGADQQPAGQSDRYQKRMAEELEIAKQYVLEMMPSFPPTPIITPMRGRGLYKPFGGSNDPDLATILHVGG